jgi:Uma2 family endonuclease
MYMTVDQFVELQEIDARYRFELVRGRLEVQEGPGALHGLTTARLATVLHAFVEAHQLGTVFIGTATLMRKDPDTIRKPDISFVRHDRMPPEDQLVSYFRIVPDLAIEVHSPSDRRPQELAKINEYLRGGYPLVWLVDPMARIVEVFRPEVRRQLLSTQQVLSGEDVIPGFQCPLDALFR